MHSNNSSAHNDFSTDSLNDTIESLFYSDAKEEKCNATLRLRGISKFITKKIV